jgi:hypothetical protein
VALSEIIGEHAPFIKRFGENTSVDGVALTSAGNGVSIENVSYQWAVEDIGGDAAVVLAAKANNITVDGQALPPELKKALPREAGVGLRYSGFNFSAMWQALADPKLAREALGADDFYTRKILPDGKILASFDNTYIRSEYYDIALSGDMQMLLSNPGKPEKADLKLVARDFDKTIKFLQDLSRENPQLSKVSFTAMMMKGFGKAQGDGSMLWHFQTNASGQITVNGQPLPMK